MMMFVLALSSLCLLSLEYGRRQYASNLSRTRAYLCMKHQLQHVYRYGKRMRQLNLAIKAAFALSIYPQAQALHKTLKTSQAVYHGSFVKKINTMNSCHFSQRLSFLYNLPYKHRRLFILKRDVTGSAIASLKKQWVYQISNFTGQKGEMPSFFLSAQVSFKNQHLTLLKTFETSKQVIFQ